MLFSFLIGKISDKIGRKIIIWGGSLCHAAFFSYFVYIYFSDTVEVFKADSWELYVLAGIYGIGDSVTNIIPSTLMSVFFTDKTEAAFAQMKLWQSLGYVIAFAWGPELVKKR